MRSEAVLRGVLDFLRETEKPLDLTAPLPAPPEWEDTEAAVTSNRIRLLQVASSDAPAKGEQARTVRAGLRRVLLDYAGEEQTAPLIVAVPAGLGKTYAAIAAAQELAQGGKRVLWLAANHSMFDDLAKHENFDASMWWHWQSMDGEIFGQPACLYPSAHRKWSELGYKSRPLCMMLCGRGDAYIERCHYRGQGKTCAPYPIVFGMHQHLFSGLDAGKFDICIVDENFLACVSRERVIPPEAFQTNAALLTIRLLMQRLSDLYYKLVYGEWKGKKRDLRGRELFDEIGELLDNALAQMEIDEDRIQAPSVSRESDVMNAPWWFLSDLAKAGGLELKAWEEGRRVWAERVWLDKYGLHLILPNGLWQDLPVRTIVLDATANPEFYNFAFRRKCKVYRPTVNRQGKLYQIAGRMYNKTAMTPGKSPLVGQAITAIQQICQQRGYKTIGIICAQTAVSRFSEVFGRENVLWFYKLRGRNDLEEKDAVFVVGTPTPPAESVAKLALALDPSVIDPIVELDEDGKRKPLFVSSMQEFTFSEDGLQFLREFYGADIVGVERRMQHYPHPLLRAVQEQLQRSELVQAVHRARLNVRPGDCWLLSSVATPEPLDGIWNEPPIAPDGISWRVWPKLSLWLEEQFESGNIITYESLAAAFPNKSAAYMRNERWLERIATQYPDRWETALVPTTSRGRPTNSIRPKVVV